TEANLDTIWTKVLSEVGFAIAGLLKKANSVAIFEPNSLVLRFSQRYNVPGGAILDGPRQARLEEVLQKTTGQPCRVRVEFVKDEEAAAEAVRTPNAATAAPNRQQRAEV